MEKYGRENSVIYRIADEEKDSTPACREGGVGGARQRGALLGTAVAVVLLLTMAVVAMVDEEPLEVATPAALKADQTGLPTPRHRLSTKSSIDQSTAVYCKGILPSSTQDATHRGRWREVNITVMDCKTTGTNLHVYSFLRCCTSRKLKLIKEDFYHSDQSLLDYSTKPQQIHQLVSSLLDKVRSPPTQDSLSSSPLIVRAPPEMRNLSPYTTAKIISCVRKEGEKAGYLVGGGRVSVMRPGDKAADLWLAASFLTENVQGRSAEKLVAVELNEQNLRVAGVVNRLRAEGSDVHPHSKSISSSELQSKLKHKGAQKRLKPKKQLSNEITRVKAPSASRIEGGPTEFEPHSAEQRDDGLPTLHKKAIIKQTPASERQANTSIELNANERNRSTNTPKEIQSSLNAPNAMGFESLMRLIFLGQTGVNVTHEQEENKRRKRRLQNEHFRTISSSQFEKDAQNDIVTLNEFTKKIEMILQNLTKTNSRYSERTKNPQIRSSNNFKRQSYISARLEECAANKNQTCLGAMAEQKQNCSNEVKLLSTSLHLILCILRVSDHIEICDLVSEFCKKISEDHVVSTNASLERLNFSKRRKNRSRSGQLKSNQFGKENKKILVQNIMSRFYSKIDKGMNFHYPQYKTNTKNLRLGEFQEDNSNQYRWDYAELNLSRGRRRVEDESLVQILLRCLSQHQYMLSASSLPFGVYPARIAFLTYQLNTARRAERTPRRQWVRGSRSDVSPEEVYGMRFFDASGERGLNNSDSYSLDNNEYKQSSSTNAPSQSNAPSDPYTNPVDNDETMYVDSNRSVDFETKTNNSSENFDYNVEYEETQNLNKTDENFSIEQHELHKRNQSKLQDISHEVRESFSNSDTSKEFNIDDTKNITDLTNIEKPSVIPVDSDQVGKEPNRETILKVKKDPTDHLNSQEEKQEPTMPLNTAKKKDKNMQMDKRWLSETVAKLNRVVDSILRSIATGDIRMGEEQSVGGAAKDEIAPDINEVTNRSITTPHPPTFSSSSIKPARATSHSRKQRRRSKKRKVKQNRDKKKTQAKKQKRCHNEKCPEETDVNLLFQNNATIHSQFDSNTSRMKVTSETLRSSEIFSNKPRIPKRTRREVPYLLTSQGASTLRSPCLPNGSRGRLMLDGQEVTIIGSFNRRQKLRCRSQVRALVLSRINIPVNVNADNQILLTGAFYYIADSAGLMEGVEMRSLKAGAFRRIAEKVCASAAMEDPLACLDYQWATNVLLHGLKIPSSQRVLVAEKINGFRVTSALGGAIDYLERH